MIHSFRLRLALSSALLAGLALAAFGFGTLWLIRSEKTDYIDKTIRGHAEREAARPPRETGWGRVEVDIAAGLSLRDASDMLLLIKDDDGETAYRSAHWPASLDETVLPWPQADGQPGSSSANDWLFGNAHAVEPPAHNVQLAQRGPPQGPGRFGPPGADSPAGAQRPPPPADEGRRPPRRPNESEGLPGDGERGERRREPTGASPGQLPREPDAGAREPATAGAAAGVAADRQPPAPAGDNPSSQKPQRSDPPAQTRRPLSAVVAKIIDGQVWRIGLASSERARVAVAVNMRTLDDEMRGIRTAFLIAMPVALFLIGFGAWIVSNRALRPINKLTAATRRITVEGLDQRISAAAEDREFVGLIDVFNNMLERLQRSFEQAHRFSADAAHELKTPLAILQGQLERAINNAPDGSALQAELTGILDEVRRLSTISRKLLLLSRADAGQLNLHREAFALSQALADLVEDSHMLAPQIKVSAEIEPDMVINADGALLQQVLHNLISNAIKYNIDKGWIRLSAKVWARQVEIILTNSSAGIEPSQRSRIFERFYRADLAHSRKIEGVGLGLALSREIARAHGGDLTFSINADNSVCFSLLLPRDGR